MGEILVLSPHLDDAVFAIGGVIARETASGSRVIVATLNTRAPDGKSVPDRLKVFADYELRLEEDRRALTILGAEQVAMGFVERFLRSPTIRRPQQIFRTPREVEGFDRLTEVVTALEALANRHPAARFIAPLGVGNHYDHVELFLASALFLTEHRQFQRFEFYEEAYAMFAFARQRHFVTRRRPLSAGGGRSIKALAFSVLLTLAAKGPPIESYLPSEVRSWAWVCDPVSITGYEDTKLRAASEYASQVALFGGEEGWAGQLKRSHAAWAGAEPLWRVG